MKRRYQLPILLMVLLLTSSCAFMANVSNVFRRNTTTEFKAAKTEYLQMASQYETAGLEGEQLCQRGKLTAVQCAKLTVAAAKIHTDRNDGVKDVAKAFLIVWARAGERRSDKPKGFDPAFQALRDAVAEVVALVPGKEGEL